MFLSVQNLHQYIARPLPQIPFAIVMIALCLMANRARGEGLELVGVTKIWDTAPHNAFTSLTRFNDRWVCAFRESTGHVALDGKMRVVVSDDATQWESTGLLSDPRGDIRDAKLATAPDGRLMLLTATHVQNNPKLSYQSLVWFTSDLKTWDGPYDVGEADIWMWGITWHKGVGYSIGYGAKGSDRFVRLYKTGDGKKYETVVDRLAIPVPFPNESAISFDANDTAYVLQRCDPDRAYIGTAKAPYTSWTWKQCDLRVGGPALIQNPAGGLLGGGRLYDPKPRMVLFSIDPTSGAMKETLTLPSGGDCSYPGLVVHDGTLYVSYYSSHEKKTSIYLARVRQQAGAKP